MTDPIANIARLNHDLRAAKANLTHALTLADEADRNTLQGAIDRIEVVGMGLPEWVEARP